MKLQQNGFRSCESDRVLKDDGPAECKDTDNVVALLAELLELRESGHGDSGDALFWRESAIRLLEHAIENETGSKKMPACLPNRREREE